MSETFRQDKLTDFTVIRNAIFRDYTLSAKAVGVACKLLSLPPDWDYSIKGIAAMFNDGESSIRSALTELENAGYLRREREREGGKLGKSIYIITDSLKCEKPHVENPHVENHAQYNTKELNTKEYTPPTVEEIRKYVQENNLLVDADYFYEYYEDTEWKDKGGDPVRNWKLKCRTWHKREVKNGNDTGAGNRERGGLRKTESGRRREDEITNTKLPPMA